MRRVWWIVGVVVGLCVVAFAAFSLLLGLGWQEHQCSAGYYPVRSQIGGDACLPIGQKPTAPYVEYPPGQTPSLYPPEVGPDAER